MRILYNTLILQFVIISSNGKFPNIYPKIKSRQTDGDPGDPLFLTPLIEANKIEEARAAGKVDFNDFKNVSSYSGFLTVNEEHNSNLFFWFFPAEENYENAPVLLWLQGGPGAPSVFALFAENGPLQFVNETELKIREYRWSREHSLLYIDSPVGTGFSFTADGYAEDEIQVGEELYKALQQFFTLFPELQNNDFFVTGESYGGKYVPAISYTILKKNPEANLKINLRGFTIGNGYCDPVNMLAYGAYLFQIGMVDASTRDAMQQMEQLAAEAVEQGDFLKAWDIVDQLIDGDFRNDTLFKNTTGFNQYFTYLSTENPIDETNAYLDVFLSRSDVRAAIHVGNVSFDSENVEKYLKNDLMQSVAPWISELLSNYRGLFYNGQMDIIVAYPLTVNFLSKLDFNGADEYKTALRYQWHVDQDLAGYVKSAGNMTEVLVRAAGHLVPADQPKWTLDLISKFIRNEPLHKKL